MKNEKNFRYDSTYSSKKKQNIQEMVEYILDKNYGDTIELEKASKILGYNIEDEQEKRKFKSTMVRIKNFLVDKGYILKSITGVGYYILKPKQISGYCYHTYIKKTQVLLEKSDRILQHMDKTSLSEIRKEEYRDVTNLNKTIHSNIIKNINYSDYTKNKSKYDSLND